MKKIIAIFLTLALALSLTACGNSEASFEANTTETTQETTAFSSDESYGEQEESNAAETDHQNDMNEGISQDNSASDGEYGESEENSGQFIIIQFAAGSVVYELNNSPAAKSLLEQLPITVQAEDYSSNEKIFYPPVKLDTDNTPTASSGAGTLAYYEPWGDVVMFYGDYSENPSLFELGHVVSGGDLVSRISGTITVSVQE